MAFWRPVSAVTHWLDFAVWSKRPAFVHLHSILGYGALVATTGLMCRRAMRPAKAAAGTIRKTHAKSIGENSVHGSDAPETAAKEIAQFFAENEIVG